MVMYGCHGQGTQSAPDRGLRVRPGVLPALVRASASTSAASTRASAAGAGVAGAGVAGAGVAGAGVADVPNTIRGSSSARPAVTHAGGAQCARIPAGARSGGSRAAFTGHSTVPAHPRPRATCPAGLSRVPVARA